MELSKREIILIILAVLVSIVLLYYFYYLAPNRKEYLEVEKEIEKKEAELTVLKTKQAKIDDYLEGIRKYTEKINKIEEMALKTFDSEEILLELDNVYNNYDIMLNMFTASSLQMRGSFYRIEFEIDTEKKYEEIVDFLGFIQKNPNRLRVESLEISKSEKKDMYNFRMRFILFSYDRFDEIYDTNHYEEEDNYKDENMFEQKNDIYYQDTSIPIQTGVDAVFNKGEVYVVDKDDDINKIAALVDMTVEKIIKLNDLPDSRVYEGQILFIK